MKRFRFVSILVFVDSVCPEFLPLPHFLLLGLKYCDSFLFRLSLFDLPSPFSLRVLQNTLEREKNFV